MRMLMPCSPSAAKMRPDVPGRNTIFRPTAATMEMFSVTCRLSGRSCFSSSPRMEYRQGATFSLGTTSDRQSMPLGAYSMLTPWRSNTSNTCRNIPTLEDMPVLAMVMME